MKRAALIAVIMLLTAVGIAAAHTELISSYPAHDDVIPAAPFTVRLVFGEPVEAGLASITVSGSDGISRKLAVRGDPHDVHAILADDTPLQHGPHRLVWRVVSADGHPVSGSILYYVGERTPDSASATTPASHDNDSAGAAMQGHTHTMQSDTQNNAGPQALPLRAVALRAAAAFAVLATAGILAWLAWMLPSLGRPRPARFRVAWLAIAALLLCCAHAWAWAVYATSGGVAAAVDYAAARGALLSATGRAELIRIVICALTLWSLVIVRNLKWASVFAMGAVIASAAIGHAAAISPGIMVPAKAIHLVACAVWLGGLAMLVSDIDQDDATGADYRLLTLRVSVIAMTALILVAITGLAQTLLVIHVSDLVHSAWGLLVLGKVGALLILAALGAANRFRNVPAVQRGDAVDMLKRTVVFEVAVFALAFVLAGALAYTAPPTSHDAHQIQTGSVP